MRVSVVVAGVRTFSPDVLEGGKPLKCGEGWRDGGMERW